MHEFGWKMMEDEKEIVLLEMLKLKYLKVNDCMKLVFGVQASVV